MDEAQALAKAELLLKESAIEKARRDSVITFRKRNAPPFVAVDGTAYAFEDEASNHIPSGRSKERIDLEMKRREILEKLEKLDHDLSNPDLL